MNNRTKNSIINIVVIVIMQILTFVYTLITKKLFLQEFSLSIYGVIDLFGTFFRSLMLLELGFGTILIYNLYKPVAANDTNGIKKQLSVFKSIYGILSIIILAIAIVILPFIFDIFKISYQDNILVYEIYIVNIIAVLLKYRFLNRISILNAGQFNYVGNAIYAFLEFVSFVCRIISIVIFKNVYLFLISLLLIPSLTYVMEGLWINKKYQIKKIQYASLDEIIKSGSLNQCKKYLFATIYNLAFSSMDNIIISMKISTDAVAYTTNYNGILATGSYAVIIVMNSLKGIMADYFYNHYETKWKMDVFSIISSFNYIITSIMAVGFYAMMENFISLWIGTEFIIVKDIFFSLLLIKILDCIFEPVNMVFTIEGYMFKEKLPLIFSAFTNIVLTIIFLDKIGLIGAFIATIVAQFIFWYGKFYHVLKEIFKEYKTKILIKYFGYLLSIVAQMFVINYFAGIFFPSVNSIRIFAFKMFAIVIVEVVINSMIVLFDEPTRQYVKNILKKTRCNL